MLDLVAEEQANDPVVRQKLQEEKMVRKAVAETFDAVIENNFDTLIAEIAEKECDKRII